MSNLKEMAQATAPRKFRVDPDFTMDILFDVLSKRAAAFQMPFERKGGIGGDRIVFKAEPDLDVQLNVTVNEGIVKLQPILKESKTTVNGMNVGKNSLAQRGFKGMMDLPLRRGAYIDEVNDTIKKLINGQPVPDYVQPEAEAGEDGQPVAGGEKKWIVALLLCLFLGNWGAHHFYVGKTRSGIIRLLTCGLFGIGTILDLVQILTKKFTDKNGNALVK